MEMLDAAAVLKSRYFALLIFLNYELWCNIFFLHHVILDWHLNLVPRLFGVYCWPLICSYNQVEPSNSFFHLLFLLFLATVLYNYMHASPWFYTWRGYDSDVNVEKVQSQFWSSSIIFNLSQGNSGIDVESLKRYFLFTNIKYSWYILNMHIIKYANLRV